MLLVEVVCLHSQAPATRPDPVDQATGTRSEFRFIGCHKLVGMPCFKRRNTPGLEDMRLNFCGGSVDSKKLGSVAHLNSLCFC